MSGSIRMRTDILSPKRAMKRHYNSKYAENQRIIKQLNKNHNGPIRKFLQTIEPQNKPIIDTAFSRAQTPKSVSTSSYNQNGSRLRNKRNTWVNSQEKTTFPGTPSSAVDTECFERSMNHLIDS
jgi:hypothetical protein